MVRQRDPWGREVFWIGGGSITWRPESDTDASAIAEGCISVTPLHLDLTHHQMLETIEGWKLSHTA